MDQPDQAVIRYQRPAHIPAIRRVKDVMPEDVRVDMIRAIVRTIAALMVHHRYEMEKIIAIRKV